MKKIVVAVILIFLGILGIFWLKSYTTITNSSSNSPKQSAKLNNISKHMKITSPVFENNQRIHSKYTCDGESINPPLRFLDVPENAKSLVLLLDDPDVPKNLNPDGVFDHWVVYNMPTKTKEISENSNPPGTQGINSVGQNKYTGPCPPDREHRYFFKLYALDTMLEFDSSEKVDKKAVEDKMKGHILDQAELIGLYGRAKH